MRRIANAVEIPVTLLYLTVLKKRSRHPRGEPPFAIAKHPVCGSAYPAEPQTGCTSLGLASFSRYKMDWKGMFSSRLRRYK